MVKVIINENKGNVDMSELTELVKTLQNDNKVLVDIVNNLFNTVNGLNKDFLIFRDKMNEDLEVILEEVKSNDTKRAKELISNTIKDIQKTIPTDKKDTDLSKKTTKTLQKLTTGKKTVPKKRGRRKNDDDVYEPMGNSIGEWKHLELMTDGGIVNKGHKTFKLPVGLNELLYIMELDNPHMNRGTAKKLMEIYSINNITFGKLIYNIRETSNFDNILETYHKSLSDAVFRVKNGVIYVNNTNTKVSNEIASEWVQILANSSKKQEKILEIQKQYGHLNKDMIRIICDSYNNPKLNTLLSFSKNINNKSFVENNPSKRRNLIQNGGVM